MPYIDRSDEEILSHFIRGLKQIDPDLNICQETPMTVRELISELEQDGPNDTKTHYVGLVRESAKTLNMDPLDFKELPQKN